MTRAEGSDQRWGAELQRDAARGKFANREEFTSDGRAAHRSSDRRAVVPGHAEARHDRTGWSWCKASGRTKCRLDSVVQVGGAPKFDHLGDADVIK